MRKHAQLIIICMLLVTAVVVLGFGEKLSEDNRKQLSVLKAEYEAKSPDTDGDGVSQSLSKGNEEATDDKDKANDKDTNEGYDFSNKKLILLGDGVAKQSTFIESIKSTINLEEATNKAQSGIMMNNILSSLSDDDIKNADIILILASINDYTRSTQIGNVGDDESAGTYCGSIKAVIKKIKDTNPDAKLVFMTQVKHGYIEGQYSYPEANSRGNLLDEYAKAITEVCMQNDTAVIDLFNESGINSDNIKEYTTDNLNLNEAGNELLGQVIAEKLKTIIK